LEDELVKIFFEDDLPEPLRVRVKEAVRWKIFETRSEVEEVLPASPTVTFLFFFGVLIVPNSSTWQCAKYVDDKIQSVS
jgi:hypothetical protein